MFRNKSAPLDQNGGLRYTSTMFGFIRRASTDGLDLLARALDRAKAPVVF